MSAFHVDAGLQKEVGKLTVQMKEILNAPLKQTPQAMVRVSDQYLPLKDEAKQIKGLVRCLIYLEDLGELTGERQTSALPAQLTAMRTGPQNKDAKENSNPNQDIDTQYVFQLELWKRNEMEKFRALLKQQEITCIQEVTYSWKAKELDRERTFKDSL